MLGCNAQYLSSAAKSYAKPMGSDPPHPTVPCIPSTPTSPTLHHHAQPAATAAAAAVLARPPVSKLPSLSPRPTEPLLFDLVHSAPNAPTVPPPPPYHACYSQSRPQLLTLTATAACLPAHYQPTCVLRLTSPFPALHCPAHCAPSAPNNPTQIPIPTAFRTALIHTPKPTSITPLTDHIRSRNSLSPSLPTSPGASPTPPDPSHVMHPTRGAPPHHCRPVPPPLNPPTPSNVPMPTASPARD